MDIYIDGEKHTIDTAVLAADLLHDNSELVTISRAGELVIDDLTHGRQYAYRREVWQIRPNAQPNTTEWAGHHFEFCRSVNMG